MVDFTDYPQVRKDVEGKLWALIQNGYMQEPATEEEFERAITSYINKNKEVLQYRASKGLI